MLISSISMRNLGDASAPEKDPKKIVGERLRILSTGKNEG
jgi:hypothetical protein